MEPEEIVQIFSEIRKKLRIMQDTLNEISSVYKPKPEEKPISFNDISDSDKYNLSQSAKLLKIDRKTLRTHADNGLIRCTYSKANKRRMFSGSELKRYYKCV